MYRSRVRAAYSLTRAVPCSRSTCFASLFSQRRYATKKLGGDNNGNADVEAALKFAKDNKAQLVDFRVSNARERLGFNSQIVFLF